MTLTDKKLFFTERIMSDDNGNIVSLVPSTFVGHQQFWETLKVQLHEQDVLFIGEPRGSTQVGPRQGASGLIPLFAQEFSDKTVIVLNPTQRLGIRGAFLLSSGSMQKSARTCLDDLLAQLPEHRGRRVAVLFDVEFINTVYDGLVEKGYTDLMQKEFVFGALDSPDRRVVATTTTLFVRLLQNGGNNSRADATFVAVNAFICIAVGYLFMRYFYPKEAPPQQLVYPYPAQYQGQQQYQYPQQYQPQMQAQDQINQVQGGEGGAQGGVQGVPSGAPLMHPQGPYTAGMPPAPGMMVPPQQQQQYYPPPQNYPPPYQQYPGGVPPAQPAQPGQAGQSERV